MNNCRTCNDPVNKSYCANCGQPVKLQRIDRKYIIREIASFFNAERGILYTVKKMFISPGKSVKEYITKDRSLYVKPIAFVIITSLIYTLVSHFFHIDAQEFQRQLAGETEQMELPTSILITNWTIEYSGYVTILVGLLMAFWVKLFFRKSGYNLFEIFVLFCYVSGISALFSSIIFIIQGLTQLSLIYPATLLTMIYSIWATGQFFDGRKASSYLKAFLSYALGWAIFSISIGIVIVFIDVVFRQ